MNFFVVGLPRSSTAWWANYLTHDGHICYHEAMTQVHHLDHLCGWIGNGNGTSDSGLTLFPNFFIKHFSALPTIAILRPKDHVIKSVRKNVPGIKGNVANQIEVMYQGLARIIANCNVLVMDFYDQDPAEGWRFVYGTEADPDRTAMLQGMKVTTRMEYTPEQKVASQAHLARYFNMIEAGLDP